MNKIKLLFIIYLIISILSISKTYAVINGFSLIGKTIVIDPGHGGKDSGATYNNILEKDINLIISKKIRDNLISKGAIVYLTRETDIDLSTSSINRKRSDLYNRAKYINNLRPDLYLSIHQNYISSSKWHGLQIFYNSNNQENENISMIITNYLQEKSHNIRNYQENNNYYMYKNIKSPGILIETGFLSNTNDRYILTHEEYQDKLSKIISDSIEYYFLTK